MIECPFFCCEHKKVVIPMEPAADPTPGDLYDGTMTRSDMADFVASPEEIAAARSEQASRIVYEIPFAEDDYEALEQLGATYVGLTNEETFTDRVCFPDKWVVLTAPTVPNLEVRYVLDDQDRPRVVIVFLRGKPLKTAVLPRYTIIELPSEQTHVNPDTDIVLAVADCNRPVYVTRTYHVNGVGDVIVEAGAYMRQLNAALTDVGRWLDEHHLSDFRNKSAYWD